MKIDVLKYKKNIDTRKYLNYQNMFWLLIVGSLIGCLLEGIWTVRLFGRWESHVNTIWGPFCLIYGVGAVTFYITSAWVHMKHLIIQFLAFALVSDAVEYLCASLIEEGLGMKAWTYKNQMFNLQGRISLQVSILWGGAGVLFFYFILPRLNLVFDKMRGKFWRIACIAFSVFMIVNMSLTVLCIMRWSERHYGGQAANRIERVIDMKYNDQWMKKRFCEWWFIDQESEFFKEYKSR